MEKTDLTPLIASFNEFFTSIYKKHIDDLLLVYPKKRSVIVDYVDLERFDPDIADKLIKEPDLLLEAAEESIKQMNLSISIEGTFSPHVRFYNFPGTDILIEQVGSKELNELVSFKGVITKRAEIMHKVKIAVFKCEVCDGTMKEIVTKNFTPPKKCESCKKFALKQIDEESKFTDIQKAEVQELLERVRGSAPAAHIELLMEDDMVNTISPGDNVEVAGVLRLKQPMKTKQKQEMLYGRFLDVIYVKSLKRDFEEIEIDKEEEKRIKEFSGDPNIEQIIVDSVAPGIYGHQEVKRAVVLQLFGGTRGKSMPGGLPIRDDIHILLIGDPGLAKSRFLRSISDIAPKSIFVSGKSTSGVGLCVAGDSLITLNDSGIFEIKDHVERNFKEGREELTNAFSSEHLSKPLSLSNNLKSTHISSPKIWKIKAPEELILISTRRGKEIKITPNTQLICISDGVPTWKKASEIKEGEHIATSRDIKPLKGKLLPLATIIKNENIRVISSSFNEITDKLAKKYGSLTSLAEKYGLDRERLYINRSQKQGVKLTVLKEMFNDVGEDISKLEVEKIFLRYGKEHFLPKYLNPDICYVAGLVAGDGDIHLSGTTGFVRLHSVDEELLEKASAILKSNFGFHPRVVKDKKRIANLNVGSVVLAEIFGALGIPAGEKSHIVDISSLLTSAGEDCVKAYLRGLFDSDGWVSISSSGSSSIGLCTTSKKLAFKVLLLLEWWGITAKLRSRKDKIGQITEIQGKKVVSKREQYYVETRGIDNFIRFNDSISFLRTNKREALAKLISSSGKKSNTNIDIIPVLSLLQKLAKKYKLPKRKIGDVFFSRSNPSRKKLLEISGYLPNCYEKELFENLAKSDIYWDEIKSITKEKSTEEFVYDLTVNGTHNFLANGIFVHNTVSAEKDELGDGGWTLKAGALVLASGGTAQLDEFDKIEDEDRSALHEVMESQQISIAKAGMVATFKTKAAILAAANPKYGRFDQNKNLGDQFDVPPTLLSRFDLIFPIVDVLDEEKDLRLAQQILAAHRGEKQQEEKRVVEKDFLRKYIAYARRTVRPQLTNEAVDKIKDFYVGLRRRSKDSGAVAITPRYLEGLVRLAEANAKIRLSSSVEERDADMAISLLNHVMKQIMTDKATGILDVDVVATGKPKSEREKLQKVDTVLDIIKDLLRSNDSAEVDKIVATASSSDIDEQTTRRILNELLRKGEIYEKEHGHVKLVGEK